MKLKKQTVPFEVKSSDDDRGFFSAYVSTWTREPDSYGDVVAKGAFADSLQEWDKSGYNIPVLWNHNDYDPNMFLGHVLEAKEDEHGLYVEATLDLDNPTALQVYRTIKNRRVNHMSFAFEIRDWGTIEEDGVKKRELRDVSLMEVSIVPHPANLDTSIETVKSSKGFTPEQIEVLRAFADTQLLAVEETDEDHAPAEGEANNNTTTGDETNGKSSVDVEVVARIKEKIIALTNVSA